MNDGSDPYFNNKISSMNPSFLNFSQHALSSNHQVFCFNGNAYSLQMAVNALTQPELDKIKSLRINITGSQIKNVDSCCFYTTIVAGGIVIFPLFFLCCDWWKRKVNKLYNVDNQGYDALTELIRKCQAYELYLMVEDNFFNRSKAEVIIESLQGSSVRNFVFSNVAGGFDADNRNYSSFTQYMRPIKSSLIRSDVSWGSKAVL